MRDFWTGMGGLHLYISIAILAVVTWGVVTGEVSWKALPPLTALCALSVWSMHTLYG